ncbi:MAG: hypothetical protein SCJ94_11445 [Bacillota bacterium]|nr:hypothetical protein [Bacillota bacterium]
MKKLLTKHKAALIIVIALLLIAGSFAYYFFFYSNILLEAQLRDQFGDAFFDDFNGQTEPPDESDLLEDVIEKYQPRFETLEDRAIERLEELFQTALAEYEEQRRRGTLNRFHFTNKYIQAGQLLEQRVDASFYDLLGRMENELNRNGLPTEILAEVEETYLTAKQQKKDELFSRLREKLGR